MITLTHLLLVSQSVEDEQALFDWTLGVAKKQGAKVSVLRVLPEMDQGLFSWFDELIPEEVKARQKQAVLAEFEGWYTQAKEAGVVLEIQVEFGKLFYRAIQYVLNQSVDWLIKQTDEASHALTAHIFDSHDLHLLRKCPCPVLLHKHGTPLPFQKVMACIDVDLDGDLTKPDAFNQTILNIALTVVEQDKANVEVLHAWQADTENWVHYWNTDLPEEALFQFREGVRSQHLKAVEVEVEALNMPNRTIEPVLPKGEAAKVIPPVVALHQVDLLVMGTLGRHGLPGIIIGNTSESILEQVNCSVLALKPGSFVSPVTSTPTILY